MYPFSKNPIMTPQAWPMFPPAIFRKAHIAYIRGGVCPGLPLPSMGRHWAAMAARVGWQLASIAARMGWHSGRVGRQWQGIVAHVSRK